jgi:hypothetical protein
MHCTGIVQNGVVVLDPSASLPEGTRVRLEPLEPPPEEQALGQRLLRFAGKAQDLPCDLAVNHDHYLHGQPKRCE